MSSTGNIIVDSLDNGLTFLIEPMKDARSAALAFFVKTGARDEEINESGISHFLEHMMFKSSKKRMALELAKSLGDIAAQANAFTSEEITCFYGAVLPEYVEEFFGILVEMLEPQLDANEFELERKVILEEIATYKDKPQHNLFEKAFKSYFKAHPSGKPILGTRKSLLQLSPSDMRAYYERRYCASNIVVVATGQINPDRLRFLVELKCSHWSKTRAERLVIPFYPRFEKREYVNKKINQCHALILLPGPSAQEEERHAFSILSVILGDNMGSKFYWKVVETGRAEICVCDTDERDGTGLFMCYAATTKEMLQSVLNDIYETLISSDKFTEEELNRAKKKVISRIVHNGELPLGRLQTIGNEWLYNRQTPSLKGIIARVKSISRTEICDAILKYPTDRFSEYRLVR